MVRLFRYNRLETCQASEHNVGNIWKYKQYGLENYYYQHVGFEDSRTPTTTTLAGNLQQVRKDLAKNCLNCWKGVLLKSKSKPSQIQTNDVIDTSTKLKCKTMRSLQLRFKNQAKLLNCWNKSNSTNAKYEAITSYNDEYERINSKEIELLMGCKWFNAQMSRKLADSLLHSSQPGDFVVRYKSTKRKFELCLRVDQHQVKHFSLLYVIDEDEQKPHYKLKGSKKRFNTLTSLIVHHSVMPEHLPMTLNLPREQQHLNLSKTPLTDDAIKQLEHKKRIDQY